MYVKDGVIFDKDTNTEVAHFIDSKGYKKSGTVFHHRFIFEYYNKRPPLYEIDHIDGDPTNNRIENLREATRAENARNRGKFKGSTSKYKGVYWCKRRKAWIAQLRHNGYTRYIGQFDEEYLAHIAWVAVAKEAQGEFFRQE